MQELKASSRLLVTLDPLSRVDWNLLNESEWVSTINQFNFWVEN